MECHLTRHNHERACIRVHSVRQSKFGLNDSPKERKNKTSDGILEINNQTGQVGVSTFEHKKIFYLRHIHVRQHKALYCFYN